MAGAPPGFQANLDRKYDIQQQQTDNSGALERAQGASITAKTPFENALQAAQTAQTNATAGTIQPLADASIAATRAGIGETQARTGLFGAQTDQVQSDIAPVDALSRAGIYRTLQQTFAPGGGISRNPGASSLLGSPGVSSIGFSNEHSVLDPTTPVRTYAMGTSNVPAPGQTQTNGSWRGPTPAPAPIQPLPPTPLTGTDLRQRLGIGKPPVGYADGTSNVPDPRMGRTGNTATQMYPDQGPHVHGSVQQGVTYNGSPGADQYGTFMHGYAKGTSKVPHGRGGKGMPPPRGKGGAGGPPMMSPQGPMGTPPGVPAPAQMASAMPGPMGAPGGPPGAGGGLQALLQASMGADRVPGHMPPGGKGDSVPAMLTPGEAVVSNAGMNHLPGGRQAVAQANAKGNAEAGRGMMKKGKDGRAVHVHIHM